jgi:phenylacetate-CoA ligase
MPFYRHKLDDAGVRPDQIERAEDLAHIPFTAREELAASQARDLPLGELACADPIDIVRIQLGSRRSGRELVRAYTERDLRTSAELGARALWACGVRPDDVVLHCRAGAPDSRSMHDQAAAEAAGAAVVAADLGSGPEGFRTWSELRPTALLASPAVAFELAELLRGRGTKPRSLGLAGLVIAGGPNAMDLETRRRLGGLWGATLQEAYGLAEIWESFAGECGEEEGFHFLGHGAALAELVEPESGRPLAFESGAQGELVLTHLDREATPLLRFRSRELVSILGTECPCGRTGFRFRPIGRLDEEDY